MIAVIRQKIRKWTFPSPLLDYRQKSDFYKVVFTDKTKSITKVILVFTNISFYVIIRTVKENKEKMQKCTFTLSEKGIKALEMFSEFTSIPKSVVVRLALSNYLMGKNEFRNYPKFAELVGKEEIEIYEKSHNLK